MKVGRADRDQGTRHGPGLAITVTVRRDASLATFSQAFFASGDSDGSRSGK